MLLPRITYYFALIGVLAWCGAIILAPVLAHRFGPDTAMGEILYTFFRPLCHQMESRSLHVSGEPLAVCARCSAIYFAFLGGTLLYPFLRRIEEPTIPPRMLLLVSALPMIVDAMTGMVGLHVITMESRLMTGAAFGCILPFFILPVLIEGVASLPKTPFHHPIEKGLNDA